MDVGGRPTKYKIEYDDQVIDIIGRQGKSLTQFARDIGVSRSTVYLWAEENPSFSDALTHAKEWSEAYWEDRYLEFMVDRNANAPLVKLYFANRFKWTDKQETETPTEAADRVIEIVRASKPAE